MVHDTISNILVLVELGFLGLTTFTGLFLLLNKSASLPYRIVSSLIMLGLSMGLLSMLIWPDAFAAMTELTEDWHTGPVPYDVLG